MPWEVAIVWVAVRVPPVLLTVPSETFVALIETAKPWIEPPVCCHALSELVIVTVDTPRIVPLEMDQSPFPAIKFIVDTVFWIVPPVMVHDPPAAFSVMLDVVERIVPPVIRNEPPWAAKLTARPWTVPAGSVIGPAVHVSWTVLKTTPTPELAMLPWMTMLPTWAVRTIVPLTVDMLRMFTLAPVVKLSEPPAAVICACRFVGLKGNVPAVFSRDVVVVATIWSVSGLIVWLITAL